MNNPAPEYRSRALSPGCGSRASSTAPPSRAGAAGCTCQKPAPPTRKACSRPRTLDPLPHPGPPRDPVQAVGGAHGDRGVGQLRQVGLAPGDRRHHHQRRGAVGAGGDLDGLDVAEAALQHPAGHDRLGADRAVLQGHDVVGAVPAQTGAALGVDGELGARAPAQAPRCRGRGLLDDDVEVQPGEAVQLLGHDLRLELALPGAGGVLEVAPPAHPGTRDGAGRFDPRRGRRAAPRTASARQKDASAAPSVIRATTRSPGRAWRTKTTRPSCRATQCPPWATGPTSTSTSLPRASGPAAARAGGRVRRARVGPLTAPPRGGRDRRSPRRTTPGAARSARSSRPSELLSCHGTLATITPGW